MEKLSPELILAISGLLTGVIAAISAFIVSRKKDKKDQVALLRDEVDRLEKRKEEIIDDCDNWRKQYNKLFFEGLECKDRVLLLEALLEKNSIELPIIVKEAKDDHPKTTSNN
jgi:hypothetical protein